MTKIRILAIFGVAIWSATFCRPIMAEVRVGPQVLTEDGIVRGIEAGGVETFKGIPYAAAPVGNLRWRAPQPVDRWDGVRDALEYGPDCMQKPVPGDAAAGGSRMSEDCLYLNVFRPKKSNEGARLPVLFWIHGGGYLNGSAAAPIFDGSPLARQGMIVVTINYRLGRLGFFAHPALSAAREGPIGNFGYMDQIQALRWVQTNIAGFGGNPDEVTISGESAGGFSVIHLITSPVTEGLFHRAIVLSGGGRRSISDRRMTGGDRETPSVDEIDANFAKSLGVKGSGPSALRALRSLPASRIVGSLNMEKLLKDGLKCAKIVVISPLLASRCTEPPFEGLPMIDGVIVNGVPQEIISRQESRKLPILIGTTAIDMPLYFPPSKRKPFEIFGADEAYARKAYGSSAKPNGKERLTTLLSISSDLTMHEPARFVAKRMAEAGESAWLYRFTYAAESTRAKSPVQQHAGELPFLFQTLDIRYPGKISQKDRAAANAFATYVGNFVRWGDPNGGSLPRWPRFDPERYELMDFTSDAGPVFGPEPRKGVRLVERFSNANMLLR